MDGLEPSSQLHHSKFTINENFSIALPPQKKNCKLNQLCAPITIKPTRYNQKLAKLLCLLLYYFHFHFFGQSAKIFARPCAQLMVIMCIWLNQSKAIKDILFCSKSNKWDDDDAVGDPNNGPPRCAINGQAKNFLLIPLLLLGVFLRDIDFHPHLLLHIDLYTYALYVYRFLSIQRLKTKKNELKTLCVCVYETMICLHNFNGLFFANFMLHLTRKCNFIYFVYPRSLQKKL